MRTLSGAALVAVLIWGIVWCDISRVIVLSLIGLATLREMLGLFIKGGIDVSSKGWLTTVAAFIVLVTNYFFADFTWVIVVFLYLLVRFTTELYRKSIKPVEAIGSEVFAMCYTILPIILLIEFEVSNILFIFFMVWINDVGAYLIGSTLGKHRLFERISPKKSWEGFWGGVVLVAISAALAGHFYFDNTINYLILGVVISVASVFGDLFESMFKRSLGVKDSGNAIPGHGGFWDRFDALFFAVPAYYLVERVISLFY